MALVEQHKDGWPHVNVLVYHKEFVEAAQADWRAVRRQVNEAAIRAGCGRRFWLEPVRSKEAMAGYFVKLCREVAKVTQAPVEAPPHFRRLRASRGLLPKAHKNEDITGLLIQMPLDVIKEGLKNSIFDNPIVTRSESRRLSFIWDSIRLSQLRHKVIAWVEDQDQLRRAGVPPRAPPPEIRAFVKLTENS